MEDLLAESALTFPQVEQPYDRKTSMALAPSFPVHSGSTVVANANGSDADDHRRPSSIRTKLGHCSVHLHVILRSEISVWCM
jgi:hypothetical protein